MSDISIHEALGRAPRHVNHNNVRCPAPLPNEDDHFLSLFAPLPVSNKRFRIFPRSRARQSPPSEPSLERLESLDSQTDRSHEIPCTRRLDALLNRLSRKSQNLSPWPEDESLETHRLDLYNSSDSSDSSFQRMLNQFPEPPKTVSPKIKPAIFNYLGNLPSWDWAEDGHLSGSIGFEFEWDATEEQNTEELITSSNIASFDGPTDNNRSYNHQPTRIDSFLAQAYSDCTSSTTTSLLPSRRVPSDSMCDGDNKSCIALSKLKDMIKNTATKLICCSSDANGSDDGEHRKNSTGTIATALGSVAEITDAVSRARWKGYFRKVDERRRIAEGELDLDPFWW